MDQEKVRKPIPKVPREEAEKLAEKEAARQADTERGRREAKTAERDAQLEDIDELLDEIDGLLEEQEVLANYRQRGGQMVRAWVDVILGGFRLPPIGWL